MASVTSRKLTRRALVAAGGSLTLGALLAACGQPAQPTAAPTKPAAAPAATSAPVAQPAAPTNTAAAAVKPAEPTKPAAAAEPTKPAAAPAAAPPASKDAVKIVWAPQTGDHANWQKSRYPLFQQQNPGVAIEFLEIPGADYRTKIFSMAATNTLPDMVFFANDTTRLFQKRNTLRPLDDLIKADNFDVAPYWPALLRDLKVKDQLLGIPNNGNIGANIYYYNADLLKASGAAEPDPKTWSTNDLLEIAKKVTKKDQVWGFQPFTKSTFFFGHYTRMFGSELISEDGRKSLLDSKEAVAAMRWLYDLVHTHQVTPSLTEPLGPMTDNFVGGKIAMYHQFVGQASTLTRLKPPFAWKALVAPTGPGGSRGEHPQGAILGITPTSKNPADAFKVVKFYCSKEDGIQHVLNGVGSPGTRTDVWQSPELTGFHPIFKMVADLIPDPKPARWAANGRDAELGDTWNNYQDKIWLKTVSFEEGVQQLQKEAQAILDKPED